MNVVVVVVVVVGVVVVVVVVVFAVFVINIIVVRTVGICCFSLSPWQEKAIKEKSHKRTNAHTAQIHDNL